MKHILHKHSNLWLGKSVLTLLLLSYLSFSTKAQTQLVQWNFSGYANTPTASLLQNNGKLVTAVGQNQAAFISAAGTTYDPPLICNGWDVPANTAYFLINFSTANYASNTITYFLGAFQFGVKSFQPQYSVASAAGPWTDFGTAVTFPAPGGEQMFTNVPLPMACDNQTNVWVRLLSTTTTFNTGGDYIDEITVQGIAMVPLPLSISNFTIENKNNSNLLNWNTESENNSSNFELQHSRNANDFSTMASIPSKALNGNSHALINYSYEDANPLAGHNYYRLKQTDKDGHFAFSKVLDILNGATDATINVYPNPAKDVLNIELHTENEAPITIILTDVTGKVVRKVSLPLSAGNHHLVTDIKGIMAGVYTLQLYKGSTLIHTQKIRGL